MVGFPQSPPQVLIIFSRENPMVAGETHQLYKETPHRNGTSVDFFTPKARLWLGFLGGQRCGPRLPGTLEIPRLKPFETIENDTSRSWRVSRFFDCFFRDFLCVLRPRTPFFFFRFIKTQVDMSTFLRRSKAEILSK